MHQSGNLDLSIELCVSWYILLLTGQTRPSFSLLILNEGRAILESESVLDDCESVLDDCMLNLTYILLNGFIKAAKITVYTIPDSYRRAAIILSDRGTIYLMPKLSGRRCSANERESHFAL